MSNNGYKTEVDIIRLREGERGREKDEVVTESPLTVFLNEKEFVTLLCSPQKMDYLAVGFLRSEGLISKASEIEELRVDEDEGMVFVNTSGEVDLAEKLYGKRTITSGCGKGTVFFSVLDSLQSEPVTSDLKIEAQTLLAQINDLQQKSQLFKATGGVHSAALADSEQIIVHSEDIGRHNAIDKIIGETVLKEMFLEDKILLSSGRLSSEIVIKGAKLRVPFVVSRAAPTSLSIELAEKMGITLVGFARGKRLNIYAHDHRII